MQWTLWKKPSLFILESNLPGMCGCVHLTAPCQTTDICAESKFKPGLAFLLNAFRCCTPLHRCSGFIYMNKEGAQVCICLKAVPYKYSLPLDLSLLTDHFDRENCIWNLKSGKRRCEILPTVTHTKCNQRETNQDGNTVRQWNIFLTTVKMCYSPNSTTSRDKRALVSLFHSKQTFC